MSKGCHMVDCTIVSISTQAERKTAVPMIDTKGSSCAKKREFKARRRSPWRKYLYAMSSTTGEGSILPCERLAERTQNFLRPPKDKLRQAAGSTTKLDWRRIAGDLPKDLTSIQEPNVRHPRPRCAALHSCPARSPPARLLLSVESDRHHPYGVSILSRHPSSMMSPLEEELEVGEGSKTQRRRSDRGQFSE